MSRARGERLSVDKVLARQLRCYLQLRGGEGLDDWLQRLQHGDAQDRDARVAALRQLLGAVNETYAQYERDVALRSRSLRLSSQELTAANDRLRDEMRAQQRVIDTLRTTANELLAPMGAEPIGATPMDAERLSMLMLQLVREREMAIEASQASRELLELAVSGAQVALWDWNIAADEAYFSPRLNELLGLPAGQQIRLDQWIELVHPKDLATVHGLRKRHLRGQSAWYEAEFRVLASDGGWRWMHSRGQVVARDAAGLALRMTGTLSDVTPRRLAEDQVKHQLRFIEQLLDALPHPIYFHDRHGRCMGSNRAFETFFGLSRESCAGRPMEQLLAASRVEPADAAAARSFGNEVQLRAHDGRVHDVVHNRLGLTGGGVDGGVLGVITDITEHKRVELELRQAKASAEAASRAKGTFLANMSHEIRTPMNGIMGLVDLTLQTVLNDTQRRYLELVRSSATSLLNIINDILDVSRIEAGRLRIECVPFTLPMLLDQVVAPLELRAREKGLALAVEVAPDVPGELLGDPLRMRQILVNLLGNAIKFTRRGSVRLNVSVQRRAGQPWLVASVIDTGVGIAADKLERIFEPFSQADASTTREFGGTGLGLTISRRLAHLMNGLLWAESTPGEGSVFHVKLPLAVPDDAAAGAGTTRPVLSTLHSGDTHWGDLAAAHGDDGGPQRVAELELPDDPPPGPGVLEVLVVDDLAMNRFLATTLVRTMGHRVTCAASGAEALRLHDERRFDLVLLDIQMPEMSGHEVAQRIRSRERERRVPYCPIVAMTAHAMPADRARSLACGMDDHLAKPVEKERLESVLQLLSRTGWRRSA